MKEKAENKKFERVINTDKREVELLIYEAIEFLCNSKKDGMALNTDEFFFRLTLDELLENAMKHGNKYEFDKKITVSITPDPQRIEIRVQDEGNAFYLEKVPDPRKEDKYKKSGRGITLLQEVTELKLGPNGNCLIAKL